LSELFLLFASLLAEIVDIVINLHSYHHYFTRRLDGISNEVMMAVMAVVQKRKRQSYVARPRNYDHKYAIWKINWTMIVLHVVHYHHRSGGRRRSTPMTAMARNRSKINAY
jgi:hypothetical protein